MGNFLTGLSAGAGQALGTGAGLAEGASTMAKVGSGVGNVLGTYASMKKPGRYLKAFGQWDAARKAADQPVGGTGAPGWEYPEPSGIKKPGIGDLIGRIAEQRFGVPTGRTTSPVWDASQKRLKQMLEDMMNQ